MEMFDIRRTIVEKVFPEAVLHSLIDYDEWLTKRLQMYARHYHVTEDRIEALVTLMEDDITDMFVERLHKRRECDCQQGVQANGNVSSN